MVSTILLAKALGGGWVFSNESQLTAREEGVCLGDWMAGRFPVIQTFGAVNSIPCAAATALWVTLPPITLIPPSNAG